MRKAQTAAMAMEAKRKAAADAQAGKTSAAADSGDEADDAE